MRRIYFLTLVAVGFSIVVPSDTFAAKKWAAIVGSSDRSSVGYTSNQPSRKKAISVAKSNCNRYARTSKSCNRLRKAWSGPKCGSVYIRGGKRSVCNR